jgi:formylglycine-generating enzyme required for sulfatase activity
MGTPPEVRQRIVEELKDQGTEKFLLPPHEKEGYVRVYLTAPYYLARCEVTVQQFRKFVEDTGYQTDGEKQGMGGFAHRAGQGGSAIPAIFGIRPAKVGNSR